MLALQSRILIASHVPPRPTIESAIFDVRNVIGHQIVAEAVAFVYRTPQLAGLGVEGQAAARVTNSIGINLHSRAVGIELENVCAILFARMRIRIVDV